MYRKTYAFECAENEVFAEVAGIGPRDWRARKRRVLLSPCHSFRRLPVPEKPTFERG